ncbi:MAG: substrate-binding domain-containing protein [Phycisphaeraceae bacterium]|nr:substrate-binding domain-containing protein [Phycisphaeraceae bacterium]
MNHRLEQLEFKSHSPVQGQIRKHVRRLVESGDLTPGERLPSTHVLARTWSTDLRTVHLALVPLVREGLLMRVPRVGTFVRRREQQLTRVGIYMIGDRMSYLGGSMSNALLKELQKELARQGIHPDVWIDSRPQAMLGTPWPELEQAVRERRIQGLILAEVSQPTLDWVKRLAIPFSMFGAEKESVSVHIDSTSMAEAYVQCVHEIGCRSVGIITGLWAPPVNPTDKPYGWEFYRAFFHKADRFGIEVRTPWIQHSRGDDIPFMPTLAFERHGYESFHRLWDESEHPEAVVVTDNVMAQGAVMAILERQVRVPRDLKLVALKLSNVEAFLPIPVGHVVIDVAETARAIIRQVQRQFQGEICECMRLAPHLVRSTGMESGFVRNNRD